MGRLDYWAMCVCCSPAALRETPPAPPVTLLRYPAVNTLKPHLKVKSREFVVFMSFLTLYTPYTLHPPYTEHLTLITRRESLIEKERI